MCWGNSSASRPLHFAALRGGTKQQTVLTLLHRQEGATVAQATEVTSWAQHAVRNFQTGLKGRTLA
ncbi:DUF3489 domain-containing protein [Roseomonas sp. KE2513]|uniref:DUF3489 domain-containing protein n=1 Tax=Roseomonas sp. KE2513 TaxID=2479202 RepID=UPI0018E0188B|nr:DUF3489 domain-containing protein [Roseomonas sp. KE2513]